MKASQSHICCGSAWTGYIAEQLNILDHDMLTTIIRICLTRNFYLPRLPAPPESPWRSSPQCHHSLYQWWKSITSHFFPRKKYFLLTFFLFGFHSWTASGLKSPNPLRNCDLPAHNVSQKNQTQNVQKCILLTNHEKIKKIRFSQPLRWAVCSPPVKFLFKNSQIPPRGNGFFVFKIFPQRWPTLP